MINQIPTVGAGRAPRGIIMLGSTMIEWTRWRMEHSGVHEAGTIDIDVPVKFSDWPFWTQQTEIVLDIYAGFPKDPFNFTASDLTLLMTARIDQARLNVGAGMLNLRGRDLTSLLTDNKSDAKYPNMTASSIATLLATNAGLTPDVQETSGKVGAFYNADHVQMQCQQTPWTLLTYLAQREGLQCFVLGRTLYFGKFGGTFTNEPYLIQYVPPTPDAPFGRSNAVQLELLHDLTLANDIEVRVRSFHGYKNAAYSATAKATKTLKRVERGAKVAQEVQHYDYTLPGLTQEQCQQKANQLYAQISKHELKIEATLPGDQLIYPWTPIAVQGTGTLYDTTYEASRIIRTFSTSNFTMNVDARSVPEEQTVTLS